MPSSSGHLVAAGALHINFGFSTIGDSCPFSTIGRGKTLAKAEREPLPALELRI